MRQEGDQETRRVDRGEQEMRRRGKTWREKIREREACRRGHMCREEEQETKGRRVETGRAGDDCREGE